MSSLSWAALLQDKLTSFSDFHSRNVLMAFSACIGFFQFRSSLPSVKNMVMFSMSENPAGAVIVTASGNGEFTNCSLVMSFMVECLSEKDFFFDEIKKEKAAAGRGWPPEYAFSFFDRMDGLQAYIIRG